MEDGIRELESPACRRGSEHTGLHVYAPTPRRSTEPGFPKCIGGGLWSGVEHGGAIPEGVEHVRVAGPRSRSGRGTAVLLLMLAGAGMALATGSSRGDGRGLAAFAALAARPNQGSPARGAWCTTPQPVWKHNALDANSQRMGSVRLAQLRMGADKNEAGGDDEGRLLWSRRLNRALFALLSDPTAWGANDAYPQEKVLWSRRLGRAVRALYTEPDLVPFESLWTQKSPKANGRQASMLSSAGMLESVGGADALCSVDADDERPEDSAVDTTTQEDCPVRPKLPVLTPENLLALRQGERVQRQVRDGRVGTGMVVVDVDADVPTVFAVLTDIDKYPERIPTVRAAVTYFRAEKLLKTQFQISKFRLQINTELRCAREANMLEFKMDPERPAPFLTDAQGFWFLEDVTSEGASEPTPNAVAARTRIWLVADIACSSLLPTAIVDYAAARALPRATSWLKPCMENMSGQLPQIQEKKNARDFSSIGRT